jgi:hypothetical protein
LTAGQRLAGSVFKAQPQEDVIQTIDEIPSHLVRVGQLGEIFVSEQEMARLGLWRSSQAGRKNLEAASQRCDSCLFGSFFGYT